MFKEETYNDFTKLLKIEGKRKRYIVEDWLRRIVIQAHKRLLETLTNTADNIRIFLAVE
jgi:hypothetical protein